MLCDVTLIGLLNTADGGILILRKLDNHQSEDTASRSGRRGLFKTPVTKLRHGLTKNLKASKNFLKPHNYLLERSRDFQHGRTDFPKQQITGNGGARKQSYEQGTDFRCLIWSRPQSYWRAVLLVACRQRHTAVGCAAFCINRILPLRFTQHHNDTVSDS